MNSIRAGRVIFQNAGLMQAKRNYCLDGKLSEISLTCVETYEMGREKNLMAIDNNREGVC